MRAFAVVGGDAYLAMPGGLTTVADRPGGMLSNQAGAVSKDTWVLASEPERSYGYWQYSGPIVPAVEPQSLVSARVAGESGLARPLRRAGRGRGAPASGGARPPNGIPPDGAATRPVPGVCSFCSPPSPMSRPPTPVSWGPKAKTACIDPGDELQSLATDTDRPGTLAYAVAPAARRRLRRPRPDVDGHLAGGGAWSFSSTGGTSAGRFSGERLPVGFSGVGTPRGR